MNRDSNSARTWLRRLLYLIGFALILIFGRKKDGPERGHVVPNPFPEAPAQSNATGTSTDPIEIDWRILAQLDYRSGKQPADLARLNGAIVRVPGYIVPLDDWMSGSAEFLLVPYVGACVHTPPPPPNQMVYVVMQNGTRAPMERMWSPVWIQGTLRIEEVEAYYGNVSYRIDGLSASDYAM
jgi:hypothetical protein